MNWDDVLTGAQQNCVAPLVFHNLKKIGMSSAVPPHVWREFELTYRRVGFQNAVRYEELRNVLRSFEDAGIEAILLKGAALGEHVWENVALREMADVDLLVREEDLDRADAALLKLGYVHSEGCRPKEWYKENHHHLAPYRNPANGTVMEIHRNIVRPNNVFRIDADGLWRRAGAASIGGVDTKVLSPEDSVIHLCLHLSYGGDFVGRVRNLSDICQVIGNNGDSLDWDWVVEEAKERNFERFIYYPLFLAADVMGARIDKEVLESLRRGSNLSKFEDQLLKRVIKSSILSGDESSPILPKWFVKRLCSELLSKDRLSYKLVCLLESLSLPPARLTGNSDKKLASRMAFLYYPVHRLFKLLFRLGGMMIRRITQRAGVIFAD